MHNHRLFVAYKPPFISSNKYLSHLKKRYNIKKGGFSGTLDPFAKGVLIVAFGKYTKLFRFLKKSPKVYEATLWLGAKSKTLDIERVKKIENVLPIKKDRVKDALNSIVGQISYYPPIFSAKKIDGIRAYMFAKKEKDINLKKITSYIYNIELINYTHPFITFRAEVSEGTYIRSLGDLIAKRLGTIGVLSSLERIKEGEFFYKNQKSLNPIKYLATKENYTFLTKDEIKKGRKIFLKDMKIKDDGIYHIVFDDFFSIIEIKNGNIKYLLNNIWINKYDKNES
ncbi:MAG TPA: tRNA pseudouridine(55) synthase TruB [Campylobacterales bacterium]|nr:tRNA pseudouridine(55) synthase TruB [Campylobacterales bacterium]